MSGSDKNIHDHTAAAIEKYLKGELSAAEMHMLEKAALEDPFLADALEGMAFHRSMSGEGVLQQDIAELHTRLTEGVATKKANPVRKPVRSLFLRYAAALILLAGMGVTFYYTFFLHKHDEAASLAKVADKPPVSAQAADTTSVAAIQAPPASEPANKVKDVEEAKKEEKPQGEIPPTLGSVSPERDVARQDLDLKKQEESTVAATDKAAAMQVSQEFRKEQKDSIAGEGSFINVRSPASPDSLVIVKGYYNKPPNANVLQQVVISNALGNKVAGLMIQQSKISSDLVFTGKVTDINNNALTGAILSLKGNTRVNALTDKDGYFSLKLPGKDSVKRVLVRYTGFEDGEITLNTDDRSGNFIQLQPQPIALNEVVISGYGAKRKEVLHRNFDTPSDPLSLVAVPAKGWPAYNEYLAFSKKLVNVDSTIKGNESISFLVDKKGKLSYFKVEQSLSPAHDSASIHMIKNGPAWQLLNSRRKSRARVIITY